MSTIDPPDDCSSKKAAPKPEATQPDDNKSPEEVTAEQIDANRLQFLRERKRTWRQKAMKADKEYRMEVLDPRKSNDWKTLRELEEDELEAAQRLRNELNKVNAPVLVRIVRKTNF